MRKTLKLHLIEGEVYNKNLAKDLIKNKKVRISNINLKEIERIHSNTGNT
jgi:hypothetical protein